MNVLSTEKRVQIVKCLVEGSSIRSTCRMTGVAKGTVLKFLLELGDVLETYHDAYARGLKTTRVQADEIWSFCHAKDKNLPDAMRGKPGVGSVWTWTAIDADSKFMVSWYLGDRDAECAQRFMDDLAGRLNERVQLTTDGHGVYNRAVTSAFGWDIDYAQLVKIYGEPRQGEARYSPCECIGAKPVHCLGKPDPKHISTSYVERANLTMRMGMRRYTRLTNAFSKKLANLRAAVALHMFYYNFSRIHQTLRTTPAQAVGLTTHAWEVEEIVGLLELREAQAVKAGALKRGKYKARKTA